MLLLVSFFDGTVHSIEMKGPVESFLCSFGSSAYWVVTYKHMNFKSRGKSGRKISWLWSSGNRFKWTHPVWKSSRVGDNIHTYWRRSRTNKFSYNSDCRSLNELCCSLTDVSFHWIVNTETRVEEIQSTMIRSQLKMKHSTVGVSFWVGDSRSESRDS